MSRFEPARHVEALLTLSCVVIQFPIGAWLGHIVGAPVGLEIGFKLLGLTGFALAAREMKEDWS